MAACKPPISFGLQKKCIMSYTNSGYGNGTEIPLEEIKGIFKSPPQMPEYLVTEQTLDLKNNEHASHSTK